jgi:hypothetical protein
MQADESLLTCATPQGQSSARLNWGTPLSIPLQFAAGRVARSQRSAFGPTTPCQKIECAWAGECVWAGLVRIGKRAHGNMKMSLTPACLANVYAERQSNSAGIAEKSLAATDLLDFQALPALGSIPTEKLMRTRMSESVLDMTAECFLFLTCKSRCEPRTVPGAATSRRKPPDGHCARRRRT